MATNKQNTGKNSPKGEKWMDPDDAPTLGAAFFKKASVNKGGKPVRGRPKLVSPKRAVSIRLDEDVIDAFKAKGPGWQTLVNVHLRKAAGLAKAGPSAGKTAARPAKAAKGARKAPARRSAKA